MLLLRAPRTSASQTASAGRPVLPMALERSVLDLFLVSYFGTRVYQYRYLGLGMYHETSLEAGGWGGDRCETYESYLRHTTHLYRPGAEQESRAAHTPSLYSERLTHGRDYIA